MPWFITVYKKYFLKNPFKSELSANSWKGERSNEKKNLKFMKVEFVHFLKESELNMNGVKNV